MTFEEIDELAIALAEKLRSGGCLGLIGDLGAGKTTFTKKICECYNITENVKSPTFTYVIEYTSGDVPVYHFDVYRINDPEEIYEIGTDIISNFGEDYTIDENLVRIDYPKYLSFDNYICVYKRHEKYE